MIHPIQPLNSIPFPPPHYHQQRRRPLAPGPGETHARGHRRGRSRLAAGRAGESAISPTFPNQHPSLPKPTPQPPKPKHPIRRTTAPRLTQTPKAKTKHTHPSPNFKQKTHTHKKTPNQASDSPPPIPQNKTQSILQYNKELSLDS